MMITIERRDLTDIVDAAMGHRLAKLVRYLPGARNRILFALQGRRFKSNEGFYRSIVKIMGAEEKEDSRAIAEDVAVSLGIEPARVRFP